MRLRFLHPALIGAVLFSLLVLTAIPASAAPRQRSSVNPAALAASPHTLVPVTVNPNALSDTGPTIHYLYVEDGTRPNFIDVYAIKNSSLTHVGNFPTSSGFYYPGGDAGWIGANDIDVTLANAVHGPCLVLGDQGGVYQGRPHQFVDSYTLNPDGSLGPLVSSIENGGGQPADVHISKDGTLVYVSKPYLQLESYALGAGCALALLATLPTSLDTSQIYFSIVLDGPDRFVTINYYTGTIDTYALTSSGGMTLLASVPGQIAASQNTGTGPNSLALQTVSTSSGTVQNLFTGDATSGPPQAQGGQYNATTGTIAFLAGSPASDPSGSNGAAVFYDLKDSILVQGEQYSSSLGVYSVSAGTPGTPGSISFLEHTPLAVSGDAPDIFVMSGPNLLVDSVHLGDIEACTPSISRCTTVAVLTYTSGYSQGMALL
jgi:hypothetical protein